MPESASAGSRPARAAAERERRLAGWLADVVGRGVRIERLADDASFRRYFRVRAHGSSWVAMDAPPGREDVAPFVRIAAKLHRAGLNAPDVVAEDRDRGFLLLEDLGDRLYLSALTEEPASAGRLYADALAALVRMQVTVDCADLPAYDRELLLGEMKLFVQWYLAREIRYQPSTQETAMLSRTFELLVDNAMAQPQCFVHRDYHSRNLLVHPRNPGIIDFQDAVGGPMTYDLVSLLRDVYLRWPDEAVDAWVVDYAARARDAGSFAGVGAARLRSWLDLMGVQRHLKVVGIFARLSHRDGKDRYLGDIPLTLAYLREIAGRYRALRGLAAFLRGLDERVPASGRATGR